MCVRTACSTDCRSTEAALRILFPAMLFQIASSHWTPKRGLRDEKSQCLSVLMVSNAWHTRVVLPSNSDQNERERFVVVLPIDNRIIRQ